MQRTALPLATVAALAALVLTAAGFVTVLAPSAAFLGAHASRSLSDGPSMLLPAVALLAAGAVAWVGRPGSGLALLAFWGAATWLASELAASESVNREARSLGVLLTPVAVPLLVHLPVRASRARPGRLVAALLVLLYLGTAVAAVGHALTFDPFHILECKPLCVPGDNVFLVYQDVALASAFERLGGLTMLLAGVGLLAGSVLVAVRGRRDRGATWVCRAGACLLGAALAAEALLRLGAPDRLPQRPMPLLVAECAAILAIGTGVAWTRARAVRRTARVRRLVELMDAGAGTRSLGETLAAVLEDPTVRVVYPIGAGLAVDDAGRPEPAPVRDGGRSVTPIERDGDVIALVLHDPRIDPDLLRREVGAAARLAMENERLGALLQAQVRELQASRERIVAAGDAARGRLERDLHDGAQQRLLAVSFELRLSHAQAAGAGDPLVGPIRAAVEETDRALRELRELAHGIWPAVLAEAGLEAALGSLADEAPIPVTLGAVTDERFPAATEAAAYLAVAEALRRAVVAGAPELHVRAERAGRATGDRLEVEAEIPTRAIPGPWLRVDDRAGAAGGRSVVTLDPAAGTRLTVELPCA